MCVRSFLLICALASLLVAHGARAVDSMIPAKVHLLRSAQVWQVSWLVSKPAAKGETFDLPAPDGSSDPTIHGATVEWCRLDVANTCQTFDLPAAGWRRLGKPAGSRGYRYRGAGTPADPCRSVVLKPKRIAARCKREDLAPPIDTEGVAFNLRVGSDRYCARSSLSTAAEVSLNTEKRWKAKHAAAPFVCAEGPTGGLPVWDDDPCSTTVPLGQYQDVMGRWSEQVDATPFEPGRTVFTGSSSIRFWERLVEDLGPWAPVQRGFGGAITWEVAEWVRETVTRHDPDAVVLFAGTNDISIGLTPEVVADAYRCVVERIAEDLGKVSISYISITPTPARWASWPEADAANQLIASIAADWPDLHFIDTSPAFLATGQPPDASLFISDGLHLSDAGYAIWRDEVAPHLEATVPHYTPEVPPLATGTRILIDLGPSNPADGEHTPSPDAFGQHWNNWAPVAGGTLLYSGEQVGDLVDSNGAATGLRLVLSSATHLVAGINAGGLLAPAPGLLGSLAVPTATEDFFFTIDTNTVVGPRGALAIEGLDPDARYGLRLFASASGAATRTTRFTVSGTGTPSSADLTTSGTDIGSDGVYDGNDDQIVEFVDLAPDASGRLHLDFEPVVGGTAYLSLLELTVE